MGFVENEIYDRFRHHPPTSETISKHEAIREAAAEMAAAILENVPEGRHQALALTAIQETMMWSNAGIAIDS